ncbi:hypothetical protein [Natroniella sp. ANB-PHB2]|uniref:hypothetical protein n=1 Tax=Natroniella sp. ANB-PHB2 TaxID=3384444 RepID=UPI0038D4D44E
MKKYILLIGVMIIVGLVFRSMGGPSFMRDSGYEITGQVVDNQGRGIEGVSFDFGALGTVETDQEGRWSKTGLKESVRVEPIKEGKNFYPNNVEVGMDRDNLYFVEEEWLEDILIWLSLDPDSSKANYEASASIRKLNGSNQAQKFSDTEIVVNDVMLQFDNAYDDGLVSLFSYREGDLKLENEDVITIKIIHPLLGWTAKEVEVPKQVGNLEITGDIDGWIGGEEDSIILEWSASNSELYKLWISLYDEQEELISDAVTLVASESYTFSDTSLLSSYDTDKLTTYIEFEVFAVNMYRLTDFSKNSGIEISTKEGPTVSNLPHN